jgi:glycosyltransferase involved in cell wall biosynthesis
MEVYARNLVPLLSERLPGVDLIAYGGVELAAEWREAPWHPAMRFREVPVSSASRARRSAAEYLTLPRHLHRDDVQLVHGLGNSVALPRGIKRVVSLHDCIHFRYPETTSRVLAVGMRAILELNARFADRILTLSDASRADIEHFLRVDRSRITVVSSGPGAAPVDPAQGDIRARLGIPAGPLVLSVSARRPHKNLERLISAVAELPDVVLVLPGYPTDRDDQLRECARAAGIGERVVLCGWVDDAELEALYVEARCMAFPSLAEGFGLPVLEAMRRGVPVAISDIPVLHEVAGEAAVYFDPHDPRSMALAIGELIEDSPQREGLILDGMRRVEQFTWERTADAVADVYRELLSGA